MTRCSERARRVLVPAIVAPGPPTATPITRSPHRCRDVSHMRFFGSGAALDGEDEVIVGLPPPTTAQAGSAPPTAAAVDLSGQAKAWFAIGPGNAEPAAPLPPLPSPARSAASVVFATAQPLLRPPIMASRLYPRKHARKAWMQVV